MDACGTVRPLYRLKCGDPAPQAAVLAGEASDTARPQHRRPCECLHHREAELLRHQAGVRAGGLRNHAVRTR